MVKNSKNTTGDPFSIWYRRCSYNFAILGGGKTAKNFLELFMDESSPNLNFNVLGLCDINPEAEGYLLAQQLGICTVTNYLDLLKIDGIDAIVEMTGDRKLLIELLRILPKNIGLIEKNAVETLMKLINIKKNQIVAEQKAFLDQMSSSMLFRQTNAAILVLNTDFTIYDVNEAFVDRFKIAKKDVLGKLCYKITQLPGVPCPIDNPEFTCPMVETLKTGESAFVIQEFNMNEGQTRYCNAVTYPLKDGRGNIVQVIEMRRDVTDEITSGWEKQITGLKSNIRKIIQEDRMISLGKLVASCVHEINNPIQGMLTFSHLMQKMVAEGLTKERDLKDFKKYLALMSKELDRCGEIVSGLLSFSRESTMKHTDVCLQNVLESVIMLIRHKCELQRIRLRVKLSSTPLLVVSDTNLLQQCFLNLVFNAIEAMPDGGKLSVTLSFVREKSLAKIEIRDTGFGIPEENLDHIFDPFFTTKNYGEGTGLGLAIVYGAVKKHGGKVKVHTKAGEGTSFVITLPIQ